jgi:hypothetical protein
MLADVTQLGAEMRQDYQRSEAHEWAMPALQHTVHSCFLLVRSQPPTRNLPRPWWPIGLRIPHCVDNRLRHGGKVVSPTHRPRFTSQKHYFCFWHSFLLEAE